MDLAKVYILIGDLPNAKKEYINALKIDSNSTLVLEELVKICFDLHETENMLYYANIYIGKDLYNEKIYELVSHQLFSTKNYLEAGNFSTKGLSVFPNNSILNAIRKNIDSIVIDTP
jgi:hypothetical protein